MRPCVVVRSAAGCRPLELEAFGELLHDPAHRPPVSVPVAPIRHVPLRHNQLGEGAVIPSTFEQLELLRTAFDVTDDYFLLLQSIQRHDGSISDFLIIELNQAGCAYMQQEREAIIGQTLLAIFPQMEHNGLLDLYVDAASRSCPLSIDDFTYRDYELFRDHRVYDIQVLPTRGYLVVTWRDVTDRHLASRNLADTAALYRLLTDNIVEVVLLLNLQEQVVWVSPSLEPMTGWREEQWTGRRFCDLFLAADGLPQPVQLASWLQPHGSMHQGRLRLLDPRGDWGWVDISVRRLQPSATASGTPAALTPLNLQEGYVITLQPVDQQVHEERRLLQRANSDPLTGLMSRAAILGRLEQRLHDEQSRVVQPIALLFCDFDDFKGINDTHGHACGDAVLQAVAERIRSEIRHQDHAGRIGGDEFLVILDGVEAIDAAIAVADKLQQAIAAPIVWGEQRITASCSIGVALHGAGEDAALFLRRADRSMYAAKAAGRHRVLPL